MRLGWRQPYGDGVLVELSRTRGMGITSRVEDILSSLQKYSMLLQSNDPALISASTIDQ